jgi:cytochrome c oxidase subunit 1
MRNGKKATADYWHTGGTTWEWTVSSPPPFHTFEDVPVYKEKEGAH